MLNSISVIIPSYNSSHTLCHTIEGILHQENVQAKEIIIVDSSDDGNIEKIKTKYQAFDHIVFSNAGIKVMPAMGRNIGAESAKGNILVFLDSDVIPSQQLLEHILNAYEKGCLVGGVGVDIPEFQISNLVALAQYYLQFNEYLPTGEKRKKPFLPSCNLFCDKDLFYKAGKFPEMRASEDVVFGLNISKFADIWFIPESKVWHIFREKWKDFLNNQKLLGKYISIYRKRNSCRFIYRGIFPVLLSPLFLFAKYARIVPRIINAGLNHIYRFVKVFPIFSIGLLFWMIGFVQGCSTKED